jgi:hypothetical protein
VLALERAHQARRREREAAAKRGGARGGGGGGDEAPDISDSHLLQRSAVAVSLLSQGGSDDARTKIGHWRVKEVSFSARDAQSPRSVPPRHIG